jgi:hypothetical protein
MSYPSFWIIFRGIVAPIVYITELSMVSYLIYYQDRRNMSEKSKIKD